MLEDLGWRIRRVWSTDWFRNPSHVTDRIHRELGCCLEEDQKVRAPVEDEADEQETEAELPGESGNDAEIVQLVSSESEHDQASEDAEGRPPTGSPARPCRPICKLIRVGVASHRCARCHGP